MTGKRGVRRDPESVLIIAEIGVNHNGSLRRALDLVDAAVEAGADVAKFQTFVSTEIAVASAPVAPYQLTRGVENQRSLLSALALSRDDYAVIKKHCDRTGIEFLSTAFDPESLRFLIDVGIERVKIPSGEITNPLLLRVAAEVGLPVIMSTGMSDLDEVRRAIAIFGGTSSLTLLHCTSAYPTPLEEVNLRAMSSMSQEFDLPVGYSDHTPGIEASIAAVALGASVIEKHLTLSCDDSGPDHRASLEPREFRGLVAALRKTHRALGTSEKTCTPSEFLVRDAARRSLVALRRIEQGELFSPLNLGAKRPGSGRSPFEFDLLVGTRSPKSYEPDDMIE